MTMAFCSLWSLNSDRWIRQSLFSLFKIDSLLVIQICVYIKFQANRLKSVAKRDDWKWISDNGVGCIRGKKTYSKVIYPKMQNVEMDFLRDLGTRKVKGAKDAVVDLCLFSTKNPFQRAKGKNEVWSYLKQWCLLIWDSRIQTKTWAAEHNITSCSICFCLLPMVF